MPVTGEEEIEFPASSPLPDAVYNANTTTIPHSSYKEFVMGMVGLLMLFIITSMMSGWLVNVQILRGQNSEIIVTPFPAQYEDYGADKVARPCVTPIYTTSLPGTFMCNFTTYSYEPGYTNITYYPNAYCPNFYRCEEVWNSTSRAYTIGDTCTLDSYQLNHYDYYDRDYNGYFSCSYSCDAQDFTNLPYFDAYARVVSYGYSAAPVTLFILSSAVVLVLILGVLCLQYHKRQTEHSVRFNIALGLAFLVGGAVIAVFGGIGVLIRVPEEDYWNHPLSGCIGSSEVQDQVFQMIVHSGIYIGWYSVYGLFYCLMTLVVIGFFIYYAVSWCRGNSVSTVVNTF